MVGGGADPRERREPARRSGIHSADERGGSTRDGCCDWGCRRTVPGGRPTRRALARSGACRHCRLDTGRHAGRRCRRSFAPIDPGVSAVTRHWLRVGTPPPQTGSLCTCAPKVGSRPVSRESRSTQYSDIQRSNTKNRTPHRYVHPTERWGETCRAAPFTTAKIEFTARASWPLLCLASPGWAFCAVFGSCTAAERTGRTGRADPAVLVYFESLTASVARCVAHAGL